MQRAPRFPSAASLRLSYRLLPFLCLKQPLEGSPQCLYNIHSQAARPPLPHAPFAPPSTPGSSFSVLSPPQYPLDPRPASQQACLLSCWERLWALPCQSLDPTQRRWIALPGHSPLPVSRSPL